MANQDAIAGILDGESRELLDEWVAAQHETVLRRDIVTSEELRRQCEEFITLFRKGIAADGDDVVAGSEWQPLRDMLVDLSRTRALQGFTPTETATFVFSFKQPLFSRLRASLKQRPDALVEQTWRATLLLDALGLVTTEAYQRSREEVIRQQQDELVELSTPVVKLWDGILALPLIGTLDSNRTQVVMESMLQAIVETSSTIAIIDITGVPMVDTLVAQHLLKTVAAARLMGADCIISGIRPQIAQTIVQLGVSLEDVVTKATLADAVSIALHRLGSEIVTARPAAA